MAERKSQPTSRSSMHQTTLRFGPALWSQLEDAARRAGVSIAQYVREAAVARMAYVAGREGDESFDRSLQSAHGEATQDQLETAVGRLRSRNVVNRERAAGLDRLNVLLEGILGGAGVGVVVLDQAKQVVTWNGASEGMWGVAPEEVVGRPFLSLDVGLPLDLLQKDVEAVLTMGAQETVTVVQAVRSGGNTFTCVVRMLPLEAPDGTRHGAVLLLHDRDVEALLGAGGPQTAET